MKLDKRGFTLVELLVVIIIIGLVIAFSVYGIIETINSSSERTNVISESSLFEAARMYSSESSNDSWKLTEDYEAFCVTVGELVNKGLIEKNTNYNDNDFVIVKRNRNTLSIDKIEMANVIGSENNSVCTGESISVSEEINNPSMGTSTSYTDKIVINFNYGSAVYKEGDTQIPSEINYSCLYGDSSSNVNREGVIEGNKCILENLNNNHNYYVMLYMNTNHGSSVIAYGNRYYKTSDFKDVNMTANSKNVKLTYYDVDNNGNSINNPSRYFKSSADGVSSVTLQTCAMDKDIFSCSGNTTDVSKNVWYKVDANEVDISYNITSGSIDIVTRIYDGSNNFKENADTFELKTLTAKFYKNGVSSIDDDTSDYVTKSCSVIASTSSSGSCTIKSPTITRDDWTVVGWGSKEESESSSWDAGTEKEITSDVTYYAVTKKELTATFEKNGATSIGSESQSCTIYNTDTKCSVESPTITRDDWIVVGWGSKEESESSSWDAGTEKEITSDVTYYAVTSYGITISFEGNGGTVSKDDKEKTCNIYNTGTSCKVTMPSATKSGYTLVGWSTSKTANSSYTSGADYSFSENKTLYAVWATSCTTKTGSTDFSASNGYKGRINWSNTCKSNGTSTFTVTSLQFMSTSYKYWYYLDGVMYINGSYAFEANSKSPKISVGWFTNTNEWYNVNHFYCSDVSVTGDTVEITFAKYNYSAFYFVNGDYKSGQFTISSSTKVAIDIS